MVGYLDRPMLLKYLKRHCLTTVGFEQAFARVSTEVLSSLFYMIEKHASMSIPNYEEYVDFLDGNGFSVKKYKDGWYSLTYLYEEEQQ